MAYIEKREFRSEFEEMHEITDDVQEIVKNSGVKDGFVIVHCNHTTAGILVTSFWDKRGHTDFMIEMDKLVPTRNDFLHTYDTPTDAAGHIKSMLVGTSQTLIVKDGKVLLGSSQGIFFAEFDGPRDRQFYVKVVSD
jgi:secondary thiamine-phosphate synthase enzyme